MAAWRRFVRRLYNALRPATAERDLAREIEAHLGLLEDGFRERGMSDAEAHRAARLSLGGVDQTKEQHRDARSLMWLNDAQRDIRYALRALARNPAFTAVAVLTLTLGIGASTAIFSVVNSVLLRPLPYKGGDQLVRVVTMTSANGEPRRVSSSLGAADIRELRRSARGLSHVSLYIPWFVNLVGRDVTVRLEGIRAEPSLFQMLGVPPLLGRVFEARDDGPASAPTIVLSYATWRSVFGGDPGILGQQVILDGIAHTVIGVMPSGFGFPNGQTQAWAPLALETIGARERSSALARLADGVSLRAAAAETDALLRAIPGARKNVTYDLAREQDELVTSVKDALVLLMVAVGFVLLIACVNVANLLLARTAARQREIAVRMALGAGRGRVVRQLVTESVVLASIGGVTGSALAFGGIRLLLMLGTTMSRFDLGSAVQFPRLAEISVDARVLALTAIASAAAGVSVGLGPAIRLSRHGHMDDLRQGVASEVSGFSSLGRYRTRGLLVVAEIAMALMLLVGGSLLTRSFVKLASVNPGYDATDVLTFQVAVPEDRYPGTRLENLAEDIVSQLRRLPGVRGAAYARQLPMVILSDMLSFKTARTAGEDPGSVGGDVRLVSRDYLSVMRVPMAMGRPFSDNDRAASQPRALIVNEALARSAFPGQNPIGKLVTPTRDGVPWAIVGVVADVRQVALDRAPAPQLFADFRQWPDSEFPLFPLGPYYLVRTKADPASVVAGVRGVLQQLEPQAALYNVATMDHIVSNTIARPRLYATLLGIFAGVAFVLAVIGIYGVMAYSVAQRTREIGIRNALGATPSSIMGLVLRQTLVVTAIGIMTGIGGAMTAARYLEGLLFGLTPLDPLTFVVVAVVFLLVAAFAAYVPARRATRVDPLIALRAE